MQAEFVEVDAMPRLNRSHTYQSDPFGLRRADHEDVEAACSGEVCTSIGLSFLGCATCSILVFLSERNFAQYSPTSSATVRRAMRPLQVAANPPSSLGMREVALVRHPLVWSWLSGEVCSEPRYRTAKK